MTTFDTSALKWQNLTSYSKKGISGSTNSTDNGVPPTQRAGATLTHVPNLGTDKKGVLVMIGVGNNPTRKLLTWLISV